MKDKLNLDYTVDFKNMSELRKMDYNRMSGQFVYL